MSCRSLVLLGRKLTDVIQNGDTRQVEKLLKQGANPDLLLPEGVTAFHHAVGQQDCKNLELTRLFLQYGADPNVRSTEGMTPLHVAAMWGNVECLRLLLLNGGDPELKDQDGSDCLDLASQYENTDCVEFLLDFMRECESQEDGCCKYTIVPIEDKESISFLSVGDETDKPSSTSIMRSKHRNTSMYTRDINSILSRYLEESGCGRKMIFDVTSPSHPYLETRDVNQSLTDLKRRSNSFDRTGSSEESFVTCASEDPDNDRRVSTEDTPRITSPQRLPQSQKFKPVASSSPPEYVDDVAASISGLRRRLKVPHSREIHNDSGYDGTHACDCNSLTEQFGYHASHNFNRNSCCGSHGSIPSVYHRCLSASPSPCSNNHYRNSNNSCIHPSSCEMQLTAIQCCADHRRNNPSLCSSSLCYGEHLKQKRQALKQHCPTCLEEKITMISLRDQVTEDDKVCCGTDRQSTRCKSPVVCRNTRSGETDSDGSSFVSHISYLPPQQVDVSYKNVKGTRTGGHIHSSSQKNLSPVSVKGGNSLVSDEDSLADYLPLDFNLSDLTINTNNSNKRLSCESSREIKLKNGKTRVSIDSVMSSASTIDYVYVDPEEGVTLIERYCPSVSSVGSVQTSLDSDDSCRPGDLDVSDNDTVIYDLENYGTEDKSEVHEIPADGTESASSYNSEKTVVNTPISGSNRSQSSSSQVTLTPVSTPDIPPLLKKLSNQELKIRLLSLGDEPGPITNSTRQTYLIRLVDLENNPGISPITLTTDKPGYSNELKKAVTGTFSYAGLEVLEVQMVQPFQKPDPARKWREGVLKSSFNYLLLDPRIAQSLPQKVSVLGELETFRIFVSAIFYIGKGKRSRPYCHLYEAIKHGKTPQTNKPSEKVKRILDIWGDGLGVISLHIFQNVIPVEAYTREACMVDAIGEIIESLCNHGGLGILTNKKKGDYYGPASTWVACQRRRVGVYLLKKALQIFLAEGERQICPPDIGIGQ